MVGTMIVKCELFLTLIFATTKNYEVIWGPNLNFSKTLKNHHFEFS